MEVYDLHKMKTEESVSSPLSVALGNFDGVHLGHKKLIAEAVRYAKEHGIASAVWTFADGDTPMPNKPSIKSITTTKDKLSLFGGLGIDYVIFESFDKVCRMTPESFVNDVLLKECRTQCAVCGFNFRFGFGGVGNSDDLVKLMKPRESIVVPPFYYENTLVSSSVIRSFIENGELETAEKYLGHPFFLESAVVHGKQLGRENGLPTINQNFAPSQVIPKRGIYACTVEIDGKTYLGAANVGVRPTVDGDMQRINCETHIIDYEGWLYGRCVKVSFYKRIRDERRFDGLDELSLQIRKDIDRTREYFADKLK